MQVDPSLIPGSGRFLQFAVICTVKSFSVVSEADVDVFLEIPCFSYDSADVANLISGSSAFSKTSIIDYDKVFHCVDHNKLWKILKEMGIPDHLTCLLRNL